MPPGHRAPKRTPAHAKRLLDALRMGATDGLACAYAGISVDTLARWRAADAEFAEALTRARGELAIGLLAKIEAAAAHDWRAAAWKLERRYPEEYGRQIVQHQGDPQAPVEILHRYGHAPDPAG